jgi:hypothetical protein
MTTKTTITLILSVFCLLAIAQTETNPQDEGLEIIPIFKKGQKLTYKIRVEEMSPEDNYETSYHLNFKFDKSDADFANATIYYSDTNQDDFTMELMDGVKGKIRIDINNTDYVITNEVEAKKKIRKNIKKLKRKYADEKDILENIATLQEKLDDSTFSIASIYRKDIKYIFSFYKKKIPYNYYTVDSIPKKDPMGNQTKEVSKFGLFKKGATYEFIHTSEVLNDGIRKALQKQTETMMRQQIEDSLKAKGEFVEGSELEITFEPANIDVDISSTIQVIYDAESAVVKSFSFVNKKFIFDLKIYRKITGELLE